MGAEVTARLPLNKLDVGRSDIGLRRRAPLGRPPAGEPFPAQAGRGRVGGDWPHRHHLGIGEEVNNPDLKGKAVDCERFAAGSSLEQPPGDDRHLVVVRAAIDHRQFCLVGPAGHVRGSSLDDRHSLLDLPVAEHELPDHEQTHCQVDEHVAPADPKHHHKPSQKHERRHARLDKLPHDPQARLVHLPVGPAKDREPCTSRHNGCGRAGDPAGHPGVGGERGRCQATGHQQAAGLHHPPDNQVIEWGAALQAVAMMAGEDDRQRDEPAEEREHRAPDQPLPLGCDVKPRHLGRHEVDEHHQPDRGPAGKRVPAREG